MRALSIIILCVGAAVAYGIVHAKITARICVEYFTIGHPPVFGTESPTLLGLGWGIIATWWVGLLVGVPLAVAALAGCRPKRALSSLVRPVATLLLVMAVCAVAAGVAGYGLGQRGLVQLTEPLDSMVPADRHARFLADLWAHSMSYLVGFVGGVVTIARVWRSRGTGVAPERLVPSSVERP